MKYKYQVSQPYQEGWISSQSPSVRQFEAEWARYIRTQHAVTCTSGTTALQLACEALRLEDFEVIMPDFTMVATPWAVMDAGAIPVFVDCGMDLNIDVSKIEEAITNRTRAIMPVHIYGRPANMKEIMEIAYQYNLFVIEDAAEAHGAEIDGKKVGSFGDIGCFSLFANKIITTGEGGIINTNSERIYNQLVHLRGMAFTPDHNFIHKKKAHNFRMSGLQANVGLTQLAMIDEIMKRRKQITEWYDEDLKSITLPRPEGSVLWMYDILVPDNLRDGLMKHLEANGIEVRYFFKPMSTMPSILHWFDKMSITRPEVGKNALEFSKRGLYLPTYTALSKEDVKFISSKVAEFLKI